MNGSKTSHIEIVFVDRLVAVSLLRIMMLGRSVKEIWYFDAVSRAALFFLSILSNTGILRASARKVNHHLGEIRDDTGEMQFFKMLGDTRSICERIKKERIIQNELINRLTSLWSHKRIVFFFDRLAERDVMREVFRITMTDWLICKKKISGTQCCLLLRNQQWFSYLQEYAWMSGIRLSAYGRNLGGSRIAVERVRRLVAKLPSILKRIVRGGLLKNTVRFRSSKSGDSENAKNPPGRIAMLYYHRKLSFDPAERSEFFWLQDSGLPLENFVLYNYVSDSPPDGQVLKQMKEAGMTLWGRGPGIPCWRPSLRMYSTFLKTVVLLFGKQFSCLVRGKWMSPYYLVNLLMLTVDYSYWLDFFAANKVRVNVNASNGRTGQVLAMEKLEGVSVAYQYSTSNMLSPLSQSNAGEDVQLVFSAFFEKMHREAGSPATCYLHTGNIYDSAIQAVCSNTGKPSLSTVRDALLQHGANFVICFFDENSSDSWSAINSNEDAAADYEFLLKWLLEDPTLGIIFKPKKSLTLFSRISRLSALIEQAKQTGRCVFMTSDHVYGSIFPAETAMISDLCVGKLLGSTAALEAYQAGAVSVMVDTENFKSHPFYQWGSGKVVFKQWKSLQRTVEKYRQSPEMLNGFGDWSPGLSDLDPYGDGNGSRRMALSISWLLDALLESGEKDKAIKRTEDKFR